VPIINQENKLISIVRVSDEVERIGLFVGINHVDLRMVCKALNAVIEDLGLMIDSPIAENLGFYWRRHFNFSVCRFMQIFKVSHIDFCVEHLFLSNKIVVGIIIAVGTVYSEINSITPQASR
jgi:hypothetical protein